MSRRYQMARWTPSSEHCERTYAHRRSAERWARAHGWTIVGIVPIDTHWQHDPGQPHAGNCGEWWIDGWPWFVRQLAVARFAVLFATTGEPDIQPDGLVCDYRTLAEAQERCQALCLVPA